MRYLRWLWLNSRGIRCAVAMRIASGIGHTALGLLMVWLSKLFIDSTIRTGTSADVLRMVMWLALTAVASVVLNQAGYWLSTLAGVRQTNDLRLRIFHCLFNRRLFTGERLHSGDVASRLAKDIELTSKVMSDTLPQMLITVIQIIGAFLLMRWFDARLAWVLIIVTPLALISGKFISRRLRRMTLDIRRDESRIQMQVQEAMENNDVLRSLGSGHWVAARLDGMQQRLMGNMMRRTRFTTVIRLIMGCAFSLGYLLAFVWGGIGLRTGTITFGVMTSFLQLVGMIQYPILQLLNLGPEVIHATASIDRLDELEQPGQARDEGQEARVERQESRDFRGYFKNVNNDNPEIQVSRKSEDKGVRLTDVSFRYPGSDRAVFEHFSHVFKPGSKTAVMGETGIGKTTLFRLLLGFIEPDQGCVEIGGDLSFVPQGNTLMSGTIRYNLLLANPDASDAEMRDALHTAYADFVFDMPDGLDTELGERGKGLSEGQAQRVAIARGLLHDGDIMLLDEISSSLDEPTERELYRRLFTRCPDKTIIFITHRTAVLDWCDSVIRL